MNREEAKQLVAECWEDARAAELATEAALLVYASNLVAARLAPEPEEDDEEQDRSPSAPFDLTKLPKDERAGSSVEISTADRPSYVPEGAPWEWTTLANGERVAMWAAEREVALHDPERQTPWWFLKPAPKACDCCHCKSLGPTALAAVEVFGRKHGIW